MNRLVLSVRVVERGAVRYTPAGLPALDLLFEHASEVSEDGRPRQVSLQIKAVAIGAIVQRLQALALGGEARCAGFLAATRNGRGLKYHVTEVDLEPNRSQPIR